MSKPRKTPRAPAGAKTARKPSSPRKGARKSASSRKGGRGGGDWKVFKIGIHLGDCKTIVAASRNGDLLKLKKDSFTNAVGFLKLGAPLHRITQRKDVLSADEAFAFLRQVDLRKPISAGRVVDVKVARQFVAHVCSTVDPAGSGRLWGVASVPVSANAEDWDNARRGLGGSFERLVLVPEPYLAVEGMQGDKAFHSGGVLEDLTLHALVVDIGSTTTNLCLVRGEFPSAEDELRLDRGGNLIDEKIRSNALVRCPSLTINSRLAREIKEEQAFVGDPQFGAVGPLPGSDLLALTEVIRLACEDICQAVVDGVCELLGRCDAEEAASIVSRVVLTGGGSRIRNLGPAVEERLRQRGQATARVLVPLDYRQLVARGALRIAERLSEEEWESLAQRQPVRANAFSGGLRDAATVEAARPIPSREVAMVSSSQHATAVLEPTPRNLARPTTERKPFSLEDLEELELFKGI